MRRRPREIKLELKDCASVPGLALGKQTSSLVRFVWVSCNLQSPGVGYCNLLLKLLSLSLDWVKLRVWPWATPINP